MVASWDIGGLGSREGPRIDCTWSPPSILPQLVPWLGILFLLALRPNRTGQAWLIWLPLLCVAFIGHFLFGSVIPAPSETANLFSEMVLVAGLGFAALWLLSPQAARSHRMLTFLAMLIVLAGYSLFTFVVRQIGAGSDMLLQLVMPVVITIGIGMTVVSIALTLAGWFGRRKYRPVALSARLLGLILAIWFVVAAPFFAFAYIASSGTVPLMSFVGGVGMLGTVTFLLLLPFLILSFLNPFFRDRLKTLLGIEQGPPIMIPPPAVPVAEAHPLTP